MTLRGYFAVRFPPSIHPYSKFLTAYPLPRNFSAPRTVRVDKAAVANAQTPDARPAAAQAMPAAVDRVARATAAGRVTAAQCRAAAAAPAAAAIADQGAVKHGDDLTNRTTHLRAIVVAIDKKYARSCHCILRTCDSRKYTSWTSAVGRMVR